MEPVVQIPETSRVVSVLETRTRHCYAPGCQETLTYQNGQIITEEFAIALAQWLTVMGESIVPMVDTSDKVMGWRVVPEVKTFCSTSCLKAYLKAYIPSHR
jgi:hypothetical protein